LDIFVLPVVMRRLHHRWRRATVRSRPRANPSVVLPGCCPRSRVSVRAATVTSRPVSRGSHP